MGSFHSLFGQVLPLILSLAAVSCGSSPTYVERLRRINGTLGQGTPDELKQLVSSRTGLGTREYSRGDLTFVLHEAATQYCVEKKSGKNPDKTFNKLKILVEAGADVDGLVKWHPQPIWSAVACDARDVIGYLISKGARTDITDPGGDTLLHSTACSSNQERFEFLIALGLDTEVQGHLGKTPLQVALECGNSNVVKVLRNKSPGPKKTIQP